MEITEMTTEDYGQVHDLWQRSGGVGLHEDTDSLRGIERYLGRNPGLSFVARDGGRIVGAVLCGHDGRRGYLHHLAVAPERRRNGVGRDLVRRALVRLQAIDIRKCHIFVFEDNLPAQEFWRSVGWSGRTDITIMSKMTHDRE
jgi:ribosomal protein S18 acetylase RimI-like enzyme